MFSSLKLNTRVVWLRSYFQFADAILDWIDEDEEARPFGAEAEYYNALATSYSPANGPLQSVEELLLRARDDRVKAITITCL